MNARQRSSSRANRTERSARLVWRWAVRCLPRAGCAAGSASRRPPGSACELVAELEELDVEVACRPGRLLDPAEPRSETGQWCGPEDAGKGLDGRASPSHRDTKVVEELGVELVDGPLPVGLDGGGGCRTTTAESTAGPSGSSFVDGPVSMPPGGRSSSSRTRLRVSPSPSPSPSPPRPRAGCGRAAIGTAVRLVARSHAAVRPAPNGRAGAGA